MSRLGFDPVGRQVRALVWMGDRPDEVTRKCLLEVEDGIYVGVLPLSSSACLKPTYWFVPWDDVVEWDPPVEATNRKPAEPMVLT